MTSPGQEQAGFLYDRMPDLSGGQVYQLWYSVGGTMISAGLCAQPGRAFPTGGATSACSMTRSRSLGWGRPSCPPRGRPQVMTIALCSASADRNQPE
ncbi:anti-sigma factor [Actinacidiphila glaucinigra]|uniref:anti-sigma factor n=1 Tax=Actinacidiphila glaucinigra TaxID=235986 RepID=UPI00370D1E55